MIQDSETLHLIANTTNIFVVLLGNIFSLTTAIFLLIFFLNLLTPHPIGFLIHYRVSFTLRFIFCRPVLGNFPYRDHLLIIVEIIYNSLKCYWQKFIYSCTTDICTFMHHIGCGCPPQCTFLAVAVTLPLCSVSRDNGNRSGVERSSHNCYVCRRLRGFHFG